MTPDPTADGGARQALPALAAMDVVLADPGRLVALLQDAEDDDAAVRAIGREFGLTVEQSAAVLDQQFRGLVGSRRAALSEALRIVRAPWGEPLAIGLRVTATGALLTLGDAEHRFTAARVDDLLDQVARFLRARVSVPDLRPVVVTTGLDGRDPVRLRIWPNGTTQFEYEDD